MWRQVVSELLECLLKLLSVYRARVVLVEVLEDALPVLDVLPETGELRRGQLVACEETFTRNILR